MPCKATLRKSRRAALGGACALGIALCPAWGAHADNDDHNPNGNITIPLSGAVPASCAVANNASGSTTNFPDLTQGASSVLIGIITETCNDRDGYTVTLTDANFAAGQPNFRGASSGTLVPYALTYNGAPVLFSSGTATLTASPLPTGPHGLTKMLAISFAAGAYLADAYSDTITITLASN